MSAALDAIGLTCSIVYIALFVTALILANSKNATLRRLTLAVKFYLAAAAVQAVNLVVNLVDIPDDGVLLVALSVVSLAAAVALIFLTRTRRNRKGDQVTAEAERTVRDWSAGAA